MTYNHSTSTPTVWGEAFDYIIVGGGSAGCLLANRLSEHSTTRVLLIEAGPDTVPGREPATIRDLYPRSYADPRFLWPDVHAQVRADASATRRLEQGRVMGGCSSVMGMLALRGLPGDYEEWAAFGLHDWTWQDVLPYFRSIERDLDYDGAAHGKEGPIPVRRHPPSDWPPFCAAVRQAFGELPLVEDMNTDFRDGIVSLPLSCSATSRVSSAMGFLDQKVRRRRNLRILTDTTLISLSRQGTRITGVQVRGPQGDASIRSREVILSTGALRSPAILMRAGIGDANTLRRAGVDVIADRPGVGANLQNHPALYVATNLKPHARQRRALRPWGMNALRYSSGVDAVPADMLMFIINKTSWHAIGRRIGSLGVTVYKAYSKGTVSIESPDPQQSATVRINLLSDERDLARLTAGVRLAYQTLADPAVARLHEDVFASPSGEFVRRLHAPGWHNAALATLGAGAMSASRRLRTLCAQRTGSDLTGMLDDESALRAYVAEKAIPLYHFVGSCRIGVPRDSMAVVDGEARVIGVEGLRVVDGSILPTVPRANTNIPIMMVAERMASRISGRNVNEERTAPESGAREFA